MSPVSDRSEAAPATVPPAVNSPNVGLPCEASACAPASALASAAAPAAAVTATTAASSGTPANTIETARHLHGLSHRGYGAPVSSWNGTHSAMSRQVLCKRIPNYWILIFRNKLT